MRGRKKGTQKTGGRQPGSVNKTTKEARELLETILYGQIENINTAMEELRSEPAKYLDACSKMFTYVLPKKTDVTSDDEKIGSTQIIFQDISGKDIDED
jgi:hypothetical protein